MMYHNTLQNNLATPNSHKELLQLNGSLYALINPTKYQALILGLYRYTREDLAKAVSLAPTYLAVPSHTQEGVSKGLNHKGFDKASNARATTNSKSYHNPIESDLKRGSSNTPLIQETSQNPYHIEALVDYLAVTTDEPVPWDNIERAMNFLLGDGKWYNRPGVPFDITRKGHLIYESSGYGYSVKLGYKKAKQEGLYFAHITISGKYYANLRLGKLITICRSLRDTYGFTACTRIDTSIDDYNYNFIPIDEMVRATLDGNVSGTKTYFPYSHYDVTARRWKSVTHYFSGPKSRRKLYCYDHLHGDGVYARRLELRMTDRQGQPVFDALADWSLADGRPQGQHEKEIAQYLAKVTIGTKDFVDKVSYAERNGHYYPKGHDREGELNLERINRQDCKRFAWWQHVIDIIGGAINPKRRSKKPCLHETIQAFERQYGKFLVKMKEVLGPLQFSKWVNRVYERGKARCYDREDAEIEQMKKDIRQGAVIA